jgi:polysaccharide export outer membrane protein
MLTLAFRTVFAGITMRFRVDHAIALGLLLGGFSDSVLTQVPVATPSQSTISYTAPAATTATVQTAASSAGKPHDNTFVIGNDDHLTVDVWNEPEISRSVPVRSDGRISLPLAGEVQAAGQTPLQLEQEIATKLLSYITKPEVTVIVEQINSQTFNILGQVAKPGAYPLTAPTTVLDAIARSGGFRDFAKQKGVYVLRHSPHGTELRIPFNYKDVIKGKNSAQNIQIQPNDTIVVP